jgi:hypothetical protein
MAERSDARGSRRPRPSTLERAAIRSLARADWIRDTDEVAIWSLRDLCLALDSLRRSSLLGDYSGVPVRDLAELAGRVGQLIRELGFTPAARYRLGLWEVASDDPLAEIFRIADAEDRDSEIG